MKSKKLVLALSAAAIGGFLLFIGINVLKMDVSLSTTIDFTAPKSSLTGVDIDTGYGQWAVAVNGNVIFKSEDELPIQPTASTTKMILALAVMEKKPFELGDGGETIVITDEMYDKYAWYLNNNGSNTPVYVGEEISEYDALASTLMVSSNNMADSLAIWAFGSLGEYREYAMNMLSKMGLVHTTIGEDASGFSESTTSTAEELATIGNKVLEQPVLAEIVSRSEYEVPVAGELQNTNKLLGELGIIGVKTGYIGEPSGYCLVSGYKVGNNNVTVALLGALSREQSFDDSRTIVESLHTQLVEQVIVPKDTVVGYYDSWWAGKVSISTVDEVSDVVYEDLAGELKMNGINGELIVSSLDNSYEAAVKTEEFALEPSFWQKILHVFGWRAE